MGTNISWTNETWNPVVGCSRVSSGCLHCYAIKDAHRLAGNPNPKIGPVYAGLTMRHGNGQLDWTGQVRLIPNRLDIPLGWAKPRRIFVNSMSDLFHEDLPFSAIDEVFKAICRCRGRHTFQILTKRPGRMVAWFDHAKREHSGWFSPSTGQLDLWDVWVGVSVEDQVAAEERIPHLLAIPTWRRFLSCEPLLGPVHLEDWLWEPTWETDASVRNRSHRIGWVIAGGESGSGYRPLNLDWARSLRDQCAAARVPFHFKQIGGTTSKANGKLLDGIEHCAFPEAG